MSCWKRHRRARRRKSPTGPSTCCACRTRARRRWRQLPRAWPRICAPSRPAAGRCRLYAQEVAARPLTTAASWWPRRMRRRRRCWRTAIRAGSSPTATGAIPDVVFMFPGGGAQFAGMARDLYETEPVFAEWMDRGLEHLNAQLDYDIAQALAARRRWAGAAAEEQLKRPSVQLPLIMIVEYALAQLWISWGIRPAALIGHSMGENTAAAFRASCGSRTASTWCFCAAGFSTPCAGRNAQRAAAGAELEGADRRRAGHRQRQRARPLRRLRPAGAA